MFSCFTASACVAGDTIDTPSVDENTLLATLICKSSVSIFATVGLYVASKATGGTTETNSGSLISGATLALRSFRLSLTVVEAARLEIMVLYCLVFQSFLPFLSILSLWFPNII